MLQVPPGAETVNVLVSPEHIVEGPLIAGVSNVLKLQIASPLQPAADITSYTILTVPVGVPAVTVTIVDEMGVMITVPVPVLLHDDV